MYGLIGCRAHDYGEASIEELAKKIEFDGYSTIQLALKKALSNIDDLELYFSKEDEDLKVNAEVIGKCLKEEGIEISVLGAYLNYAGSSDLSRSKNIELLKEHINIAKSMHARMVGTETGSLNDDYSYHVDNHSDIGFNRFKEAIIEVLPLVESENTLLAVEAVSHHIINTPKRMFRLIQEIGHERVKVIVDICNIITIDNYHEQDEIIKEMFELLEEQILVVHVKDFDFVNDEKVIVPLGEGKLNIKLLLKLINKSLYKIDMIAEDVQKEFLASTYKTLKSYAG